jgi:hypothetical protein
MVVCEFISRSKSLLSSQKNGTRAGCKKGPARVAALSVTHACQCPAPLATSLDGLIVCIASEAHEAIGSRPCSRSDGR